MASEKDDEILGKAYDKHLMKRLLKYVLPYKKYVVWGILLSILVAGLGPVRPYLTKIAVDYSLVNKDYNSLMYIAFALMGSLILQSVVQYYLTYYTQLMGQKVIFDIRVKLFDHVQKLALRFFDKTPIGRIVTRLTNDIESLNELFSTGIVTVFSDVFIILWIFGFMFFMAWDLSLVTLTVLPVVIFATTIFRKKVRVAYRDVRFHLARLNTFMQEHISGMNVVQIFGKENEESKTFTGINDDHKIANVKSIFYYAVFFPVVDFLSSLAITLIIWYGGASVIQNHISIGVLFAFIQYTEMFFRPIRDLSEKYNVLQTAMASSERIFKLFDDETFIKNPDNPIEIKDVKGEIEFDNVSFAYNPDEYVLKNISFKINPGQTVAIVGATGAGKTSIINILTRFYDINQGTIKLDGVDIRQLDKRDLRKYISIVLQDVFLFSGTVLSNINLNDESISIETVKEAAKTVGADKYIESLPNGYNEEVKEKGSTMSVGQKQLISFARALAYNPKILILDEATSSVDTETEILIQNAIHKLLVNRTSIVIAHRLSTIQNADKIIVMHKGLIREIGNHQELLAKRGIYYKLYQLQYKDQEISKSA
ncbi:MAG: ABC transporter ATP-binding protein [bacterium]